MCHNHRCPPAKHTHTHTLLTWVNNKKHNCLRFNCKGFLDAQTKTLGFCYVKRYLEQFENHAQENNSSIP